MGVYLVVSDDRVLFRSESAAVADAWMRGYGKGVLCEVLSDNAHSKSPEKTALVKTRRKPQRKPNASQS